MRLFVGVVLFCTLPARAAAAQQPATRPSAGPPVEFLAPDRARAALVDETNDPYFKLLQPLEMSAKTGRLITGDTLDQQRDQCRRRYQQAVLEFTPQEKQAIETLVSRMAPSLAKPFPLFAETPWSFIKIAPQIEGGNCFTRGRHIVLAAPVLEAMLDQNTKGMPEWAAFVQSGELLLHEQLHVVQRQHPERFAKMYIEFWGFRHADKIDGADWLTDHQLLDPDATDTRWVYSLKDGQRTRWIWPLPIIGDVRGTGGPSFADMQMVAVALEPAGDVSGAFRPKVAPNGNPMTDGLRNFPQFTAKFAPSPNVYHPNEAAADLFAHIAVVEDILPDKAPPEAKAALERGKNAFKPTRDWFEKILASQAP